MPWFELNNKHTDEFDIAVNSITPAIKPSRRVRKIYVPGKSGFLHIDEDTFDEVSIFVKMTLMDLDRIQEIKNWLDEGGKLVLSYDENHYYNASAFASSEFKFFSNEDREVSFLFSCHPFKKEVSPDEIKVTDDSIVLHNRGVDTFPIITFDNSITINGETFTATEEITVNAEAMIVVDSNGDNAFDKLTGDIDDFIFKKEYNNIDVIGNATIHPNWCFL